MADEKEPAQETQPHAEFIAPEAEVTLAFSGPAVLTNKFYITLGAHGVRISFAEKLHPEAPPVYRTAVVMSPDDARMLGSVLIEVLAPSESAEAPETDAAPAVREF